MTNKQKRFCDEYLRDLNATQAAIRAGYSKKTAKEIGSQNLTKPEIKDYIKKRMEKKESELIADQDEILKYFTAVMRGEELDERLIVNPLGEIVHEKIAVQANRIKSAEMLGRAQTMFTDKMEQTVDMELNINIDYGDD